MEAQALAAVEEHQAREQEAEADGVELEEQYAWYQRVKARVLSETALLQTAKGKCDQLDQLESTQATLTKREHKLAQSVANWRRSKRWRRSCRS